MAVRTAGRLAMTTPKPKAEPGTATAWGRCAGCRCPGLAFAWQFGTPAARCGFCGDALIEADTDLSAEAARVIAAPLRRGTGSSRGTT